MKIFKFLFLLFLLPSTVVAAVPDFNEDHIQNFIRDRNRILTKNPGLPGYTFTVGPDHVATYRLGVQAEQRRQLTDEQHRLANKIYKTVWRNLAVDRSLMREQSTWKKFLWNMTDSVLPPLAMFLFRYATPDAHIPFIDQDEIKSKADAIKLTTIASLSVRGINKIKTAVGTKFFTPAVFSLNDERLQEEVRILSVISAVRMLNAGPVTLERREKTIGDIISYIRVTPSRRTFTEHLVHTLTSIPGSVRNILRRYQRLEIDENAYLTQLLRAYQYLPSYNILNDHEYGLVMRVGV